MYTNCRWLLICVGSQVKRLQIISWTSQISMDYRSLSRPFRSLSMLLMSFWSPHRLKNKLPVFFAWMMQGPTVSPVYNKANGIVEEGYYSIVICVPKTRLYDAVKQLRKVKYFLIIMWLRFYHTTRLPTVHELILLVSDLQAGGSGVLVSPLTYIFDEEPPRWLELLEKLKQFWGLPLHHHHHACSRFRAFIVAEFWAYKLHINCLEK